MEQGIVFQVPISRHTQIFKKKGDTRMEGNFRVIEDYLMVRMPEEIDHHQSDCISREADSYIVRENINHIVFDFEDTKFMDSSGIGIIMGRYKKIVCFGGRVIGIHADRQIKRILLLSGLHKVMEIID